MQRTLPGSLDTCLLDSAFRIRHFTRSYTKAFPILRHSGIFLKFFSGNGGIHQDRMAGIGRGMAGIRHFDKLPSPLGISRCLSKALYEKFIYFRHYSMLYGETSARAGDPQDSYANGTYPFGRR
jgi:hypothetical protein